MKLGALLCVVAVGIAVAATAGAASQGTPGVTDTNILIGGTFPLTGPAQLYSTIPAAENAYYSWVNNHGQVHGRTITLDIKDDQYNPSQTPALVKQLVEQDHVFAIVGSLGTAPALATWNYLNGKGVPQSLLATGDAYWGLCGTSGAFKPVPGVCNTAKRWTIGWQPDYPSEARVYAKYILAHNNSPKIGVLYQNDAYGKNYLAGLKKGLGSANQGDIVDTESYNVGDSAQAIGAHIAALYAHGADTVVLFSTPTPSIQSLVYLTAIGNAHNWHPTVFLNNVSANRVFLKAAENAGANTDGVISTTYVDSYSINPNHDGMQLADQIITATGNQALINRFHAGDSNIVYGLAVAWTAVDALKRAGTAPTRGTYMKALRTLNETGNNANPFVYPGMDIKTDSLRTFPMQQLQLMKWDSSVHDWNTFGGVLNSGK